MDFIEIGSGRTTFGTGANKLYAGSTPVFGAFLLVRPAISTGPAASNTDAVLVGGGKGEYATVIAPDNFEGEFLYSGNPAEVFCKAISGSQNLYWAGFAVRA